MSEVTFTYDQVQLMLKEAGDFAYAQGKLETQVKVVEFLEAMIIHPSKPGLDLIAERLKSEI
ncbi:MAG: hypothetical protein ACR2IJ_05935 [Fluviibacter sp.]